MENLIKRKGILRAMLKNKITKKVSNTIFKIETNQGQTLEIDTTPRQGSLFSADEFAIYRGCLVLIIGFGQCSCFNGETCDEAKAGPMMFMLMEEFGVKAVLKEDLPEFKKI